VVVRDFNVVRVAVVPAEADAPLVIDPDAPLARAVAFQRLKPVAGWNTEILQPRRRVAASISFSFRRAVPCISRGRLRTSCPSKMAAVSLSANDLITTTY